MYVYVLLCNGGQIRWPTRDARDPIPNPKSIQVDLGSCSVIESEKLRRVKARLRRLRPGLAFTYESI